MNKHIVTTDNAPSSPLYSQAVKIGSTVYVSGMAGIDVATKRLAGATIQEQTRQALRNCAVVVDAAGGTLDDVVKIMILMTDLSQIQDFREIRNGYFPRALPASRESSPQPAADP